MTYEDYLLHVFYLIDTELAAIKREMNRPRLRARGPDPKLDDAEVITMELAGEFLGLDRDKAIYRHFRHYHLREFPALARTHRTAFCRQSANLWQVKRLLHARVMRRLPLTDPALGDPPTLWVIDSFPLRTCKLARVPRSKLFKGLAAYGHDPATPRDLYYGFRVHLRCAAERGGGFCAQVELTGANVADLRVAGELAPPGGGAALADRNYWHRDELRAADLRRRGLELIAPFKKVSSDPDPARSKLITKLRQIIEPVIGQLATRFNAQRTWARDLWHLCARLTRKILAHTVAVLISLTQGHAPLQLDLLLDS
jgi:hypothetical protein